MNVSLLNILVEFSFLSLFFAVIVVKWKDRDAIRLLLTAVFYGFLVEILTLVQLDTYSYGQFILVIGGLPLWIATSWGVLISIAIWTSNRLFKRSKYLPFSDGLMLLGVDLIVDPIAVFFGFWRWHYHGQGAILGVPYGNFIAWFMVGFLFSFFFRFFKRNDFFENVKYELYYPFALLTALPSVLLLNLFPKYGVPEIVEIVGFFAIITVSPLILYFRCELNEEWSWE